MMPFALIAEREHSSRAAVYDSYARAIRKLRRRGITVLHLRVIAALRETMEQNPELRQEEHE
jgi:hypothetical protein